MPCDFCGDLYALKHYKYPDFTSSEQPIVFNSIGGWGACGACNQFIEREALEGLVQYVVMIQEKKTFKTKAPPKFVDHLTQMYKTFFQLRGRG